MTQTLKTMRGVWMTGHGDFDKLDYRRDIPVPKPGRRDVLIRVMAAAVNNTDINTRIGWYAKEAASDAAGWAGNTLKFPRIQGADICGYVVAVGADVDQSLIGARVLVEPCLQEANGVDLPSPWYVGSECDGGFAQYTVVAARHAHVIFSKLTDVELASFPCSYSTAENMLTRASVTKDDRVLITGASGGVGSAAIQLATARGADVVAVTSAAKAAGLRALGASVTLDRADNPAKTLGQSSVDVVIDLVGGPGWPALLDTLRPFGRYAVAGAIGGADVALDLRSLYLKDLSFFGCTVLAPQVFPNLIKRIERSEISPLVARVFPLAQVKAAQKAFLSKAHTGKIVLSVD